VTITAYVALGSNLGDRRATLDVALRSLETTPGVSVIRASSYHETAAVGGPPGQGPYLNGIAELATDLGPEPLLNALLAVEQRFGRQRGPQRDTPRTLDLDIILYGDLIRFAPDPIVPHPRMHERAFVLAPLVEIAPEAVHPGLRLPARALLTRLTDPRPLAGLRTVITGSTTGIGQATARAFAAAGAQVIVHGRNPTAAATEGVPGAQALAADLRDPNSCDRFAEQAWSLGPGGIDIWVNNAGADTLTGPAAQWPFERKLEELWAVDVRATMQLSREIGRRMKEQGWGVILTTGWDQAETGMEGDSGQLFAACKGAIMAFTRSLAVSLAPQVRVNGLAPGWIKTAWGAGASEAWQERAIREAPLARWGTPDDVAAMAVWLASPAAAFVTGQIMRVNGGAIR
jgi:2-amino-4-hydroxy-6-hydroxymethyldihydropteridine diphosphokinase